MRFEFILIWNHGIKYYDKIIKEINNYDNLKILKIIYKKIENIEQFIDMLYKLDNKSKHHISAKTQYLKNIDKNFILIFIKNMKNINDNEISKDIYNLKWKIRNDYNPIFKDLNYHPHPGAPLKKGITHNHIIHSNDNNEESLYLAKKIGFFYQLKNSDNYKYNLPIHLPIININNKKKINIENLTIGIWNKPSRVLIKKSPHYNFVELISNNKNTNNSEYDIYINNILNSYADIDYSHKPERFKKLINEFDINKYGHIVCSGNNIVDGAHRISILLYKNIKEISAVII